MVTNVNTLTMQAVRQMVEPMKEGPVRPIDFIVVGPIEDDNQKITGLLELL